MPIKVYASYFSARQDYAMRVNIAKSRRMPNRYFITDYQENRLLFLIALPPRLHARRHTVSGAKRRYASYQQHGDYFSPIDIRRSCRDAAADEIFAKRPKRP